MLVMTEHSLLLAYVHGICCIVRALGLKGSAQDGSGALRSALLLLLSASACNLGLWSVLGCSEVTGIAADGSIPGTTKATRVALGARLVSNAPGARSASTAITDGKRQQLPIHSLEYLRSCRIVPSYTPGR